MKRCAIFFDRAVGQFSGIDEKFISDLQNTFRSIDVQMELDKMRLWLMHTPKGVRRKGNAQFIVSWLSRLCPPKPPEHDIGPPSLHPDLDMALNRHLEQLWSKTKNT